MGDAGRVLTGETSAQGQGRHRVLSLEGGHGHPRRHGRPHHDPDRLSLRGGTTLLNRILGGDHGLRVAVLVNDFGAVNIDAELVVGVEDDVISLANGCVCCTIRDDLVQTVLDTIARPEAPEYILLEASGVADPAGIVMTFADGGLREHLRLDGIACVLDADQVFAYPEHPALMELKVRQVGFSACISAGAADTVTSAR